MTKVLITRRPGRRPVATRNNDPIIKALFNHIDACGFTYGSVEEEAGVARGRLYKWKSGMTSPTFILLAAVAETVGLKLILTEASFSFTPDLSQMELVL